MYIQKQSALWWTRNLSSTIYFIREATGVIIAFYFIQYIIGQFLLPPGIGMFYPARDKFFYITFAASIFHTLTWFWVSVKLTPFPLKKVFQYGVFLMMIVGWLATSYFILHFLYEPR